MLENLLKTVRRVLGFREADESDRRRSYSPEEIREFVRLTNEAGGIYHRMELGEDLVLDGDFDMTKYIHHFGVPEDLSGKTVLDVGAADGYFSFLFERRGAEVTALDINPVHRERFLTLRDMFGLKCKHVLGSIYDIDESFGQFDFVFCSALLLHLSDQFQAIRNMRAVCRETAIVATTILSDERCPHGPFTEFIGTIAPNAVHWWEPNMLAFQKMMFTAGFADVQEVSRFLMVTEPSDVRPGCESPMGVLTGHVDGS